MCCKCHLAAEGEAGRHQLSLSETAAPRKTRFHPCLTLDSINSAAVQRDEYWRGEEGGSSRVYMRGDKSRCRPMFGGNQEVQKTPETKGGSEGVRGDEGGMTKRAQLS